MVMKRNKRVHQCQMRHFFGCFSKNLFGFLFVTMTITIKKMPACYSIGKILVRNISGISLKTPFLVTFRLPVYLVYHYVTIRCVDYTLFFTHNDLELSKQSLKKRDLYHFMNFSTENIYVSFISQVIRVIL